MFSPRLDMMQPPRRLRALLAALALLAGSAHALEPIEERLRMRIEGLPEQALVPGVHVATGGIFSTLYAANGFHPLWTSRVSIDALVDLVERAPEEGLLARDYHAERLGELLAELDGVPPESDPRRVDLDLLLTDSLLRYVYHLRFGKVDPVSLDPRWNFRRDVHGEATLAKLVAAFGAEDLAGYLAAVVPRTPHYLRLKDALARYRAIDAGGGWAPVTPGPTLERGAKGERVRGLRRRLATSGELPAEDAAAGDEFDEALELAVAKFQQRHGLVPDGLAGPATIAALSVPVQARIDQLRVNMERARWIVQDVSDDYLTVNIATAETRLVRGGRTVWFARVVIGQPYRKTPVFKSKITYLVFNPTWTVPPTILREDLLPSLKTEPGRLDALGMTVLDDTGKVIDPATIDWPRLDVRAFPYQIRQAPGARNPLGRVKFMLPNPYFVYLHDTPDKRLFKRAERSFSSGCIRVEDAVELARLLLDDPVQWSGEAVERAIADGNTRTVFLRDPLPVLVLYMTADAMWGDEVRFVSDVYGRDANVLRALNGPFVFSPPEGFTELLAPAW